MPGGRTSRRSWPWRDCTASTHGRGGSLQRFAQRPSTDWLLVGIRRCRFNDSVREVSPQWDVIIVAFSTPDRNAPEGTMQFHTPVGIDPAEFKADIAYLKSQGKKVMISLGGGGQHFTLADPERVPNYISSVTRIVTRVRLRRDRHRL